MGQQCATKPLRHLPLMQVVFPSRVQERPKRLLLQPVRRHQRCLLPRAQHHRSLLPLGLLLHAQRRRKLRHVLPQPKRPRHPARQPQKLPRLDQQRRKLPYPRVRQPQKLRPQHARLLTKLLLRQAPQQEIVYTCGVTRGGTVQLFRHTHEPDLEAVPRSLKLCLSRPQRAVVAGGGDPLPVVGDEARAVVLVEGVVQDVVVAVDAPASDVQAVAGADPLAVSVDHPANTAPQATRAD